MAISRVPSHFLDTRSPETQRQFAAWHVRGGVSVVTLFLCHRSSAHRLVLLLFMVLLLPLSVEPMRSG
jgi:hypothetical protein